MTRSPAAVPARWAAITSSVRGASHDRSGLPNQDAVRSVAVDGAVPGLVGAVADGHGGARYVRSDTGSSLAVDVACDAAAPVLTQLGATPDAKAVRDVLKGLAATIVARWRAGVDAHHAGRPFTDEERTRGGGDLDGDRYISYGCTLVLALMGPSWIGLLQIGDGDAFLVAADGSVTAPVPGDDRLVGGETTSLCLPDAVGDARIAFVDGPQPELVVLASDGYGNSFASDRWREEAGHDLIEAVHRDGLTGVSSKLPGWLAASAQAGGDDVSMVLACRTVGAPTTAAAVAAPVAATATASPVPSSAGGRRRVGAAAVVAALLVGAVAGAAGGWLARGSGTTTTTTTTSTTTTSTTIAQTSGSSSNGSQGEPAKTAQQVSMRGPGFVVTFTPGTKTETWSARRTLVDSTITPKASIAGDPFCNANVAVATQRNRSVVTISPRLGSPQPVDVTRPVVSLTCTGNVLWLLSFDASSSKATLGRLELADTAHTITWHDVD